MICKNCQTEVDGKATFCPNCGQSLTTPCPRCHAPVTETARFCHRCGMPLDGSAICGVCGSVVPSGAEFCPTCGSAKDGRRKCTGCGNIVEADCKFCPDCGNPLSTTAPRHYATRAAKPREHGNLKAFVYGLVRRWTIVAVLVTVFILSFFGMVKVPCSDIGLSEDATLTATEIVSGMFRMIDAPTQEKVRSDFTAFKSKNAYKKWSDVKCLQKFGIMRAAVTKEALKETELLIFLLPLGILQLGIWGTLLGFLIFETIRAIQFSMGTDKRSHGTIALALAFTLILCYLPICCYFLAGCAVAILLLSACGIAGLTVCRYVVEKQKFDVRAFLRPTIGVCFGIVLFCIFMAGAFRVELQCPEYVMKGGGTIDCIYAQIFKATPSTAKVETFFNSIIQSVISSNNPVIILLDKLCPKELTALEACSEFIPGFIAMGYLTYFSGLAFTGIIAWVLIANLTALVDGEKTTHLAWDAVAAGLAIALMVFVIVSVSLGNSMVAGLEQQDVLLYKLAGMPIVAVVFACLNLVKSIVFAVLDKRKTAREIPVN